MDIRFEGCEAVVNFVVKEINYGGYISADASQAIIYDKGEYSLYAKYARNEWSFQTGGGFNYKNTKNDSVHSSSEYYFENTHPIVIDNCYVQPEWRQRRYYFAAQATRSLKSGNQLVMKGGLQALDNPEKTRVGVNSYDGMYTSYLSGTNFTRTSPYIRFSYLWVLDRTTKLKVAGGFSASLNSNESFYKTSGSEILNNIKERDYSPTLNISFSKTFSSKDQLSINFDGGATIYKTWYRDNTNSYQHLTTQDYELKASWNHMFRDNWSMMLSAGVPVNLRRVNFGKLSSTVSPSFMLYSSLRCSRVHAFSLLSRFSVDPTFNSSYVDVDLQESEYEGFSGNTKLNPSKRAQLSFSYYWTPTNRFQLSFVTNMSRNYDAVVTDYKYLDGIIYNFFANSGHVDKCEFKLNSKIEIVKKKLTLSPNLSLTRIKATCIYPLDFWQPSATVTLTYTPTDKLYFMAYYSTPNTKVYHESNGGYGKYIGSSVMIQGGYNIKNWSFTLMGMPFYKNKSIYNSCQGLNIRQYSQEWSTSGGRRIEIMVKYTIPFGKKVGLDRIYLENNTKTIMR